MEYAFRDMALVDALAVLSCAMCASCVCDVSLRGRLGLRGMMDAGGGGRTGVERCVPGGGGRYSLCVVASGPGGWVRGAEVEHLASPQPRLVLEEGERTVTDIIIFESAD